MEFIISDVVEMGHSRFIGGSVKIDIILTQVVDPAPYLEVIDSLDHCLITDSEEIASYSLRHFLLDESKNLYYDVCSVINYMLQRTGLSGYSNPTIVVTLGKTSFKSGLIEHIHYPTVVNYHIEG